MVQLFQMDFCEVGLDLVDSSEGFVVVTTLADFLKKVDPKEFNRSPVDVGVAIRILLSECDISE